MNAAKNAVLFLLVLLFFAVAFNAYVVLTGVNCSITPAL